MGLKCKAFDKCGTIMVCDVTGALVEPSVCP
jgi:hypothetical protein